MFDANELKEILDLHAKSYSLLLWINKNLKSGILGFHVVHQAMSSSEAAREWLGRHFENLPEELRPQKAFLDVFSKLFSSYLMTSFELMEKPKMIMKSDCGCYCGYCSYLAQADRLKTRNPGKNAAKYAMELKKIYLASLGESLNVVLSQDLINGLLSKKELKLAISTATYVHELIRRSAFASQGEAALVLWREIAWESGFINGDKNRPFHRPKPKYKLNVDDAMKAEKLIATEIISTSPGGNPS